MVSSGCRVLTLQGKDIEEIPYRIEVVQSDRKRWKSTINGGTTKRIFVPGCENHSQGLFCFTGNSSKFMYKTQTFYYPRKEQEDRKEESKYETSIEGV